MKTISLWLTDCCNVFAQDRYARGNILSCGIALPWHCYCCSAVPLCRTCTCLKNCTWYLHFGTLGPTWYQLVPLPLLLFYLRRWRTGWRWKYISYNMPKLKPFLLSSWYSVFSWQNFNLIYWIVNNPMGPGKTWSQIVQTISFCCQIHWDMKISQVEPSLTLSNDLKRACELLERSLII